MYAASMLYLTSSLFSAVKVSKDFQRPAIKHREIGFFTKQPIAQIHPRSPLFYTLFATCDTRREEQGEACLKAIVAHAMTMLPNGEPCLEPLCHQNSPILSPFSVYHAAVQAKNDLLTKTRVNNRLKICEIRKNSVNLQT